MAEAPSSADARRRLAVYAAPRGASPFGARAARWMGRHIDPLPAPELADPAGLSQEQLWELTSGPRVYGFHGTLKPPFHLAAGSDPVELDAAVGRLAARLHPVVVPLLEVGTLGGFAALLPDEQSEDLSALAAACVVELDEFRRAPDELELARRRRGDLTHRQGQHLVRWGYPYVLEEFRFHLTLTRRLRPGEVDAVLAAARRWFAPDEGQPYVIDELCVVDQPAPGESFVVTARHPIGTRTSPPPTSSG